MATITALTAGVLAIFAATLIMPFSIALGVGDWRAVEAFAILGLSYVFMATILFWSMQSRMRPLSRVETFTFATLIWLVLCLAAMPAFMIIEGAGPVRAMFEATSAVTALGTTLAPVADIKPAMAVYRATCAWTGGFLIISLLVYVMGAFEIGGIPGSNLRLVLRGSGGRAPRFRATLAGLFLPYALLTALCVLILIAQRIPPLTALVAGLSVLSTNGFLPAISGGSLFANVSAELTLVIFMLIAGSSFVWLRMILDRRFDMAARHRETYFFLAAVVVMALATWIVEYFRVGPQPGTGLGFIRHLFDTASIMSTTGIVHDTRFGLSLPWILALLLAVVGATNLSPSGGIGLYRIGAMFSWSAAETRRLMFPNAAVAGQFAGRSDSFAHLRSIWSFFFTTIVAIALISTGFAALGHSMDNAIALTVGGLSSVATLVNVALASSPTEALPGTVTLLAGAAIAGRVGILVLIASLVRHEW